MDNKSEQIINRTDFNNELWISYLSTHLVYTAINKNTGQIVVFNEVDNYFESKPSELEDFLSHLLTLSDTIPGLVKIIGYQLPKEPEDNLIIATNFMKNGSLAHHLDNYHHKNQKDKLTSTVRTKIIFGIASTMKKLHNNNYSCKNLAPSNILFDENFEPLIDLDYYRFIPPGRPTDVMRPPLSYCFRVSPETFLEDMYCPLSNVYQFAIILYQMFVEEHQIKRQFPRSFQWGHLIMEGKRPERQSCIPDCYWELIERCWQQNPEDRPTFAEITEILKDDRYVLHDNGEPDLNEIHRYRNEIEK